MDPQKYESLPSKSDALFNITRSQEYCAPEYSVEGPDRAEATRTGHLEILRIKPVSAGSLPSFSARWDNSKNTIDVDLVGLSAAALFFKLGRMGYQGHHPAIVSSSPRVFHVDIRIPNLKVYEAHITCNVNISRKLSDDAGQYFSDSVDGLLK